MARIVVTFLATMNIFILLYAPQPLLPWLSEHYGISIATASLTVSLTIIALAAASLALAPLLDRWDRKKTVGTFCLLLVIPSVMLTVTNDFGWILFWRMVHGLFIPGVTAVLVAYVSEEFPSNQRGRAMGAYVSATVTGGLLGRVIAGPIAEEFSWHAVFAAVGLISLAIAVIVWIYLPRSQNQTDRAIGGFLAHFRNSALLGTFFIGFSQFFSFIGFFTYLPFYASSEAFHLTTTQISMLYITYIFGIFSAPIAGYLSDRIGRRATMASGHLVGLCGILLTLYPSLPALIAGASILAFGNFASQSATTAYVTDVARGSRGAASSLYLVFFYIGGGLGAYIPGLLWSRYAWYGLVATTTITIVLALFINYLFAGGRELASKTHTSFTKFK